MVMDDGVQRPILYGSGGVLIIIKDGLNAFPIRQGNLDSWVDSVCNTEGPAAGGFHNEALTQPAAKRPQGHDKLLQSGSEAVYGHAQGQTQIYTSLYTHAGTYDNTVTWECT